MPKKPASRHEKPGAPPPEPRSGFISEMKGISEVRTSARHLRKRAPLTADAAIAGIQAGNRTLLAQAITLIESRAAAHQAVAREILRRCLPDSGNSIRIGITGVPGAGKSTFIETFGKMLCAEGNKVAVLAVDPSSSVSGGSVLGDKTRMEELSREPKAFIRPSPASGTLGGVAARTREAMLLCEAAGFNILLVETVGVGQSEIAVRSMVDFFLLLQIAGAGDELQGIKKGVIEMADAIVVNKADGDNKRKAETARGEYNRVLHYLTPYTPDWKPQALACSSQEGTGVAEVWQLIECFTRQQKENNAFDKQRRKQNLHWFEAILKEAVLAQFHDRAAIKHALPGISQAVASGELPVMEAVERLMAVA